MASSSPPEKRAAVTADQRLAASFQEITEFVRQHGRLPERDPADMTEARLAMRLRAIAENEEQASALRPIDESRAAGRGATGDCDSDRAPETIEDAIANDPFGLLDDADRHL